MAKPKYTPTADLSENAAGCLLGAELLKIIAHPTRLRILALLCRGELPVGELSERLGQPPAIVSQHLRLLRVRELVAVNRCGGRARYRLAEEHLRRVLQCLEECLAVRMHGGS